MKKHKLILIGIVTVIVVLFIAVFGYFYKQSNQVTESTFIPTYKELTKNGYKLDNEIIKSDNFKDVIKDTNINAKVAYVKTTNKSSFKKIQVVTGNKLAPLGYMSAKIDNKGIDLGKISQPVNVKEIVSKLSKATFELEIFVGDKVKIKKHEKQNSYIKYKFKLKDFVKGKLSFEAIYDLKCYQGEIDAKNDSQNLSKYKVTCPKNSSISTMKEEIASLILNG